MVHVMLFVTVAHNRLKISLNSHFGVTLVVYGSLVKIKIMS